MFSLFKLNNYIAAFAFFTFLCGVIFPWRDGLGDGYFAHQRIVQAGLLVFLASYLVIGAWRRLIFSVTDVRLKWGALLLYSGGMLSTLLAISTVHASLDYVHWVLLGILFISCVTIRDDIQVKYLGVIFLLLHGFLVFLAILYLIFSLVEGDPLQPTVIYPSAENIRFFNQVQVFILPLLLLALKHPRFSPLIFVLFLANVLLLCIGGARGAALVLCILLCIGFIAVPVLRGHIWRALFASVLAVALYLILLWLDVDGLHDISRSGSSGRIEMWVEIISGLQWHHLLWGVGPANYTLFTPQFIFGHPHNSVLQWILEWGGIATIGAAMIVGRILYKVFLHLRAVPNDYITLGLLLAWSAALAYSLVDGVIVMPIAQTLFVAFAGLLWGRTTRSAVRVDNTGTANVSMVKTCLVGCLVLLMTVPYVYLSSQYYLQQSSPESEVKGPRFWVNGVPLVWPKG